MIIFYNNCTVPAFISHQQGVTYTNSSTKINVNNIYFVDTKFGEVLLILPANPEIGDNISFLDVNNTWNVNNLILVNNTKKINNKMENLIINLNNVTVTIVYCGDSSFYGWKIIIY
jgi:hypothetical protein